jgi:hypothetical protein
MNTQMENKMTQLMSEFKIEFSEFFKGFSTNYTQELSRTSLSPLMREIDLLKTVQNDNLRANISHQSKYRDI